MKEPVSGQGMGMPRRIVGVAGSGFPKDALCSIARELGKGIAKQGWVLVTGGKGGVMEEASKGASEAGGLVLGILPGATKEDANPYVAVPIVTNMGHARNVVLAHTVDALVAIGGEFGTLSEMAISRKLGKPVLAIQSFLLQGVVQALDAADALRFLKGWLG